MTRISRAVPKLFLGAALAICGGQATFGSDDLYSVNAGSVDKPDVVTSETIPTVGDEIKISAKVRGPGKHPVPVRFVISAESVAETTLEAKWNEQEGGADGVEYSATWRPTRAAIYNLRVQVDPDNTSADSTRGNNQVDVMLPVVWRDLHILTWASTRYMRWVNRAIVQPGQLSAGRISPDLQYWKRRGRKVLVITHPLEREIMKLPEDAAILRIVKDAEESARGGADGVIVDETGSYGTPDGLEYIRRFGVAADQVRAKLPNLMFYDWIAGPLHREEVEIAVRNGHILVGECYDPHHATHGPTWRARLQHYTHTLGPRSLISLGIGRDGGRHYEPWVENSVRMIRELEPGMPGICYYIVDDGEKYEGGFNEFLDGLTLKYFIMPVLTFENSKTHEEYLDHSPLQIGRGLVEPNKPSSIRVRVRNIGGTPARNVGISFHARDLKSGERTEIARGVIAEIGNGTVDIIEQPGASKTERLLDGVLHPMGRFADTSRVVLEQAILDAQWIPKESGQFKIEVEIEPSPQYTLLNGFFDRQVEVATKAAPTLNPTVAVTPDDIWLSSWQPNAGQAVDVQVCIHNVNTAGSAAENVPVKVYARQLSTNDRLLLQQCVIQHIGTEVKIIEEDHAPSLESKVIDGVKHPISRDRNQSKVFFNRALVDVTWTPSREGYYRIEVDIDPTNRFVIRKDQGSAAKTVPVAK